MLSLNKWPLVRPASKTVESRFYVDLSQAMRYVVTKKNGNYLLEVQDITSGKWTSVGRFSNQDRVMDRVESLMELPLNKRYG